MEELAHTLARDPLAFVDAPPCLARNNRDEILVNRPD